MINKKPIIQNRIQASSFIGLFTLLIYNAKFVAFKFFNSDLPMFFLELMVNYFLIFAFFFICSFNKKIFNFAAILILTLSTIFAYIYNKFGIVIDEDIIANALDNIRDVSTIISYPSVTFYLIFLIIIPSYLAFKIKIIPLKNPRNYFYPLGIFIILAVILGSLNHVKRRGAIFAYPPINLVDSIISYYKERRQFLAANKNLIKITDIINDAKVDKDKIKNLKVVLIIGESARSINFGINGYARNTTPQIQKIKNLISFKNVSPCGNLTNISVACILSGKTEKDFDLLKNNSETIIKLFQNLSFNTSWFSAQKAIGDNNVLFLIASQSQKYLFRNNIAKNIGGKEVYDEYLLSYLTKQISEDHDDFIILHSEGSHFLFHERYPDNFKIFTPVCEQKNLSKCTKQSIINSYDNSILYTDDFIAKVIDKLKNKNAIVLYVSDHGQFLGESGIYYHGSSGSNKNIVHKVPMFLWMSDSVLKNQYYLNKFKKAQEKVNDELSHDNIFDSLLDCAGIDSKELDRNLSLCR